MKFITFLLALSCISHVYADNSFWDRDKRMKFNYRGGFALFKGDPERMPLQTEDGILFFYPERSLKRSEAGGALKLVPYGDRFLERYIKAREPKSPNIFSELMDLERHMRSFGAIGPGTAVEVPDENLFLSSMLDDRTPMRNHSNSLVVAGGRWYHSGWIKSRVVDVACSIYANHYFFKVYSDRGDQYIAMRFTREITLDDYLIYRGKMNDDKGRELVVYSIVFDRFRNLGYGDARLEVICVTPKAELLPSDLNEVLSVSGGVFRIERQ